MPDELLTVLDSLGERFELVRLERYRGFGQWQATLNDVPGYDIDPLEALRAAEVEIERRRAGAER